MSETCDDCGTKLIDRCGRCKAPVCCPRCCERDSLRAQLAAVEAERDKLRVSVSDLRDKHTRAASLWIEAKDERDRLQGLLDIYKPIIDRHGELTLNGGEESK